MEMSIFRLRTGTKVTKVLVYSFRVVGGVAAAEKTTVIATMSIHSNDSPKNQININEV